MRVCDFQIESADLRFTGRDHHSVHPLVRSLDVKFKGRQHDQGDGGAILHTILAQFHSWILKLLSIGKCNRILAAEVHAKFSNMQAEIDKSQLFLAKI